MIAFPLISASIVYRIVNTLNPPLLSPLGRGFGLKSLLLAVLCRQNGLEMAIFGLKCLVLQCFADKVPWKMANLGLKCLILQSFANTTP